MVGCRAGTGERRIFNQDQFSGCIEGLRKIAAALERSGDNTQAVGCLHTTKTLPTHKIKCLIAAVVEFGNDDRSADGAAELVAPQFALAGVEEIAGVEQIVAEVLKQCPVQLVAAALEHHPHYAAGEPSIFRRVSGGLKLEFL